MVWGFSLQWLLLSRSTGSRLSGLSSCSSRALESTGSIIAPVHRLSCSVVWDLARPGIKSVSPPLAGDSSALNQQGSPDNCIDSTEQPCSVPFYRATVAYLIFSWWAFKFHLVFLLLQTILGCLCTVYICLCVQVFLWKIPRRETAKLKKMHFKNFNIYCQIAFKEFIAIYIPLATCESSVSHTLEYQQSFIFASK